MERQEEAFWNREHPASGDATRWRQSLHRTINPGADLAATGCLERLALTLLILDL